MNNKELQTVSEEKDLGVIIQDNLKVDKQVAASVAKANKMLGMIRRSIKSRDEKMMLQLYKSVVRPHVEFAISSWSPHFKKDIEAIEKIQHRFTRLLPRIKHLSYKDRLIKLNLTTLERRCERGDIIQTYKIMHGLSDVNINELLVEDDSITRRHSKKVHKQYTHLDSRKYFYSQRVIIRPWNNLSQKTVIADSVNALKNNLDASYGTNWRSHKSS